MMRNPWKPHVLFMEIWRMAQLIGVSFLSADNPGCSEYVSSHLYISEHSAPHQRLHFHCWGFSSTRPHLNPFFRRYYCEQQMLRNHYPKNVRSTAPTPYPWLPITTKQKALENQSCLPTAPIGSLRLFLNGARFIVPATALILICFSNSSPACQLFPFHPCGFSWQQHNPTSIFGKLFALTHCACHNICVVAFASWVSDQK